MNEQSAGPKDEWGQFAEDVAACACHVACALVPDTVALRELQKQALRMEARILRGLLAFVEGQLARTTPSDPSRPGPEKIPIQ